MPGPDVYTYTVANSVAEVNVTSAGLTAAARHIGEHCKEANAAYIDCKKASGGDPKPCVAQGAAVTNCARAFFVAMRSQCGDAFEAQMNCLADNNMEFKKCRKTQDPYDKCVWEKMHLHGAFQTYDTSRSDSSYRD